MNETIKSTKTDVEYKMKKKMEEITKFNKEIPKYTTQFSKNSNFLELQKKRKEL